MRRYTARQIWDMEECQSPRMGSVILGVDGGASNTVCVCIPATLPFADPLPVLSRTVAGCSNHNSVGGGDEVANKILHNSVGELVSSIKAVVQRLGLSGEDGEDLFPLVMVGKVLEANKRWDIGKEVIDCVTKTYPGAYPIHPKVWTNVFRDMAVIHMPPDSTSVQLGITVWWSKVRSNMAKDRKKEIDGIVMFTMWNIWKERNSRIFTDTYRMVQLVANTIIQDVHNRKRAFTIS